MSKGIHFTHRSGGAVLVQSARLPQARAESLPSTG